MQKKLLFLTNQYFFQPTVSALSRMNLDCATKVVSYHNFENIPQVYAQYEEDFDAAEDKQKHVEADDSEYSDARHLQHSVLYPLFLRH